MFSICFRNQKVEGNCLAQSCKAASVMCSLYWEKPEDSSYLLFWNSIKQAYKYLKILNYLKHMVIDQHRKFPIEPIQLCCWFHHHTNKPSINITIRREEIPLKFSIKQTINRSLFTIERIRIPPINKLFFTKGWSISLFRCTVWIILPNNTK